MPTNKVKPESRTTEEKRFKPAPRSGAAGWGDRFLEPDPKAVVDRVMDPDRSTVVAMKKEVTGHGR